MKPKAELIAATRTARHEAGLVAVTVWVKPGLEEEIVRAMNRATRKKRTQKAVAAEGDGHGR